MLTSLLVTFVVFYAGAIIASGRSWCAVRRGAIGFSALRDVTGIGDRATLRRLFGLTRTDGAYQVSLAAVLRHRRPEGIILTDLPVHTLFLGALSWAALHPDAPAALAVLLGAGAHALLLGATAVSVLARSRRVFIG